MVREFAQNELAPIAQEIEKAGMSPMVTPQKNCGIIFRSYKTHVVLPHYSDEDRIVISFNININNFM